LQICVFAHSPISKELRMLKLHIIQATCGDCLILEYGTSTPRFILIDGGVSATYKHLRPVLRNLKASHGDLDALVLTHVDDDHVGGLLKLTDQLKRQQQKNEPPTVDLKRKALWFNSFSAAIDIPDKDMAREAISKGLSGLADATPYAEMVAKSIAQGDTFTQDAMLLDMSWNPGLTGPLVTADGAPRPLASLDNLTLTVVGPLQENLDALRREWIKWLKSKTKFAAARAKSVKAASRELDESAKNLSSIMLYAEADGRTMLLTGDGRSDHLLAGLKQAGLLRDDGKPLHVDLLKLPHHGSIRNITTRSFFHIVTADTYVISADGKNDNPDQTTLKWLVEAVKDQRRQVEIAVTNSPKQVKWMVDTYPPAQFGYRLRGPIPRGKPEIVWPF